MPEVNEERILVNALVRYFEPEPGSIAPPTMESSILEALRIYFQEFPNKL